MTTTTILLIVVLVFLFMLVIEVPIGHSLAVAGLLGISLTRGFNVGMASMGSAPFESVASYSLSIVPMYILLGMLAMGGKIAEHVFQVAERSVGRIRGGLGMATVAACAGFAAVTGSSVATAATLGKLTVGEMRKRGYPDSVACGIVAGAGTLGILIPPSIILAMYGILTGESIAALLTAGIVPGIITAIVFGVYIFLRYPERAAKKALAEQRAAALAKRQAAVEAGLAEVEEVVEEKTRMRDLPWRGPLKILVVFTLIMGGVFTGWFTVTESGALGALFVLIMMIIELRKEGLKEIFRKVAQTMRETASTTSMSFFLLVGSMVLTFYFVSAGIPSAFARWLVSLNVPAILVPILLLLAMIPLGMALDAMALVIIVVPLAYPVVTALGFNGIWFAICFVILIEIGQMSPPVDINVFIVAGVTKVKTERVFRGIFPFVGLELLMVALLFVFPEIATWLPGLILG